MISLKQGGTLLLLALLLLPSQLRAEPAFDIDLKELDRQEQGASTKSEKKKVKKPKKAPAVATKPGKARQASADSSDYIRYTVKPGDHIFKILIVQFGMSNEAAERLVPEIVRLNDISNIKSLTVGRTLLIPRKGQQERAARSEKKGKTQQREHAPEAAATLETPLKSTVPGPSGSSGVEAPAAHVPPATKTKNLPIAPAPVAPAKAPLAAPPVAVASPKTPAAPEIPPTITWICSVTEKDPAKMVDAVLNALSISWSKNKIIVSDEGASNAFSIRVDRYFEYKGARYIVSLGESDPYSYTLIRLLEGAGYRVLRISGGKDFQAVSENLLRFIGLVPDFGRHALQGWGATTGFLLRQEEAGGRQVMITGEPVDHHQKWVMTPGCGVR
jgi:hypothetical protein